MNVQSPREELQAEFRKTVCERVKVADLPGALEVFDEMVRKGGNPTAFLYNAIFSVAGRVTGHIDKGVLDNAVMLFEHMVAKDIKPNEAAYSSVIKMCTLGGDGPRAASYLKRMLDDGIDPRLRTYAPLLSFFADAGDTEGTVKLFEDMAARNVMPTQPEYAALIRGFAHAHSHAAIDALLRDIMEEHVHVLEPALVEVLEKYYSGMFEAPPAPAAAGKASSTSGSGTHAHDEEVASPSTWPWRCAYTTIDPDDFTCGLTGETLRSLELAPDTHSALLKQVEGLANKAPGLFSTYKAWLAENGPFDVIVDGANVAFCNQNFDGGAFMYSQIEAVVDTFQRQGKRVLLILSKRWLDQAFVSNTKTRKPFNKRTKKKLKAARAAEKAARAAGGGAGRAASGNDISPSIPGLLASTAAATVTGVAEGGEPVTTLLSVRDYLKETDVVSARARVYGEKIGVGSELASYTADTLAAFKPRELPTVGAPAVGGGVGAGDTASVHSEKSGGGSWGGDVDGDDDEDDDECDADEDGDEDAYSSDRSSVLRAPTPAFVSASCAADDTVMAPGIVSRWTSSGIVYKTLPGTNDDWFWLFAALVQEAQPGVMVISNDLMRDHHFQMLAPRAFTRWRERHQVKFRFEYDEMRGGFEPIFSFPTQYSHRMQPSVSGVAWYFPVADTKAGWLVAWKPDAIPGSAPGVGVGAATAASGSSSCSAGTGAGVGSSSSSHSGGAAAELR